MIGVDPNTPPKRIVFRFHYYFQKVIGFLGTVIHVIPSCRQKNCVQHQLSLKNPSRWIVDTMTDTIGATMPRHFLTWILMILLGITWYKNLLMILRSLAKLSHCETRGTSTSIEDGLSQFSYMIMSPTCTSWTFYTYMSFEYTNIMLPTSKNMFD